MEDFLISEFYQKMEGANLDAFGILDSDSKIHTLGTDSKIIGRIFEMFAQPILSEIAAAHGLTLKTPESQTVYPDFILMKSEESTDKIAIDIKTTYIDSDQSTIKFTLGSFGSYMRNNTKNIEYKYTDYAKHYVIGFIYKRNDAAQESRVYNYEDRDQIAFPYYDVKYFIQEKYKIAGDKPGSGNTENLGSFSTKSIDDLKNGNGPFSELGPDAFDLYWKYYPKYRAATKEYSSLDEFIEWLPKQGSSLELLHAYDHEAVLRRVEQYKQKRSRGPVVYQYPQERHDLARVAEPQVPYGKK